MYLGNGYYGVEAASQGYFGKAAADLEPHEAALLAALVRSPSSDAPSVGPARALKRRNLVLRLMQRNGFLSDFAHCGRASAMPIPGASARAEWRRNDRREHSSAGLYFQEEVRRQLFAMFGAEQVLRGGLRVHSSYDPELQRQAEAVGRRAESQRSRRRASRKRSAGELCRHGSRNW